MKISDDELRGRVVISGDGIAIGEVSRLFVDCTSWRVESIGVALIQSVGDAVVLAVKLDALRAADQPVATEPAPLH